MARDSKSDLKNFDDDGATIFQQEQNRIRGVVSLATGRSGGRPKGAIANADQLFAEGIRLVLLDSRRKRLSDKECRNLVRWASGIKATGISNSKNLLAFGPGKRIFRTKGMDFPQELAWLTARLQPVIIDLAAFRTLATQLDQAFWNDQEELVWKLLSVCPEGL